MKKTFIPDNYKTSYRLDTEKKTFRQYKRTAFAPDLLPDPIRLEKNNGFNSITGAENLLRIRNASNWTKCTLTGLRPAGTSNFYYSDLPIKGKKSLIVVFVSDDTGTVEMRVCKQFYPHTPTDRARIIQEIIKNF